MASSCHVASDAWHTSPDGARRSTVWPRGLNVDAGAGADSVRIPGHYHALLALAGETPETAQQIEKDLPRTGATFAVQGLLKPGGCGPLTISSSSVLARHAGVGSSSHHPPASHLSVDYAFWGGGDGEGGG